jgi:hypothetical protein
MSEETSNRPPAKGANRRIMLEAEVVCRRANAIHRMKEGCAKLPLARGEDDVAGRLISEIYSAVWVGQSN